MFLEEELQGDPKGTTHNASSSVVSSGSIKISQLRNTFQRATPCIFHPLNQFEFYAQDGDRDGEFNLQTKTYSCRMFDLTGLPCVHTLDVARSRSVNLYTSCSKLE